MNKTIDADQPGGTDSALEQHVTSTTALVRAASGQVSRLVRDELRLIRAETAAKARRAGGATGLFGGVAVVALYGVTALLVTLVLLLAQVMPAWLAALIVTVALFSVVTVMAMAGRGQVRRVGSIVPEQTVDSVKADLRAVRDATKRRRRQ
ncbi:MAG: hypothetical protein JWP76_1459 [Dactylosporangium sp.]|nr:hypothetical protein [Dactylosporangium sp.]